MLDTVLFLSSIQNTSYLSNFHLCPVVFRGKKFRSVEHSYQYAKCSILYRDDLGKNIYKNPEVTPKQAKYIGKIAEDGNRAMKKHFNNIKFYIMVHLVFLKFEQNYDLQEKLLATGVALLGEASCDRFWGLGGTEKDLIANKVQNLGNNFLGKILMMVRSHFQGQYSLFAKIVVGDSMCSRLSIFMPNVEVVSWPGADFTRIFRIINAICHPAIDECYIMAGTNNLPMDPPWKRGGPKLAKDGALARSNPVKVAMICKSGLKQVTHKYPGVTFVLLDVLPRHNDACKNATMSKISSIQQGVRQLNCHLDSVVNDLHTLQHPRVQRLHCFDVFTDERLFCKRNRGSTDLHLNDEGSNMLCLCLQSYMDSQSP